MKIDILRIFLTYLLLIFIGCIIGEYKVSPIPSITDKEISACHKIGGSYIDTGNSSPACLIEGATTFISPKNLILQ